MVIIGAMTRNALMRQIGLVDVVVALMARFATSLLVAPYQFEVGIAVVFEVDLIPR